MIKHYSNEHLCSDQFPILEFDSCEIDDAPLVVFLTGGPYTARFAYGADETEKTDFLAHWLNHYGYNFLGMTPPIQTMTPCQDSTQPWQSAELHKATAEIIAHRIIAADLPPEIILFAWHYQGDQLGHLFKSLQKADITVKLFIAVACEAPGFTAPNQKNVRHNLEIDNQRMLELNQRYGREIIHVDTLAGEFVGESLIQQSDQTPIAQDYREFPLCTTLIPDKVDSGELSYRNHHVWSSITLAMLQQRVLEPASIQIEAMPLERQIKLRDIVESIPNRLNSEIDGTHLFFVGEHGAHETADRIRFLDEEVDVVLGELDDFLDHPL